MGETSCSHCPDPFSGAAASAPLGAIEPLRALLGHTQALKSGQLPEGLGLIPNQHGEGRGVGTWPRSLGTWPAGQQAPRSRGDESPPAWAGGSSLLTRGPGRWQDLPPRPSCACYLCPAAAPGPRRAHRAPLGAKADLPAAAGPEGTRFPSLLFGSAPRRRKGCVSGKEAGL